MSNYSVLKQDINNNIYENQTQQITGTVLNAILNEMTASLGAGYQFAGVATVGMNPGDPDQRVFYLAGEGIYTSFGGIQVPAGKLGVLKWDNRWTLQTIDGLGGGGANLTGYVSVASTDDLPDEGVATLGYLCGTNLYLYVGEGGDTKEGKYQNCGSFRGPQGLQGDTGVGIASVTQTTTSTEDEGINVITVTKEDGTQSTFQVRNGSKGSQGIQGPQGVQGEPGRLQAQYKEVETLPTASADTMDFIYLVESQTPSVYDMYYTEENQGTYSWKGLGTTAVQLSDYATKAEVNQLEAIVTNLAGKFYGVFDDDSDLPEGDIVGYAFVGTAEPLALFTFDGEDWTDTEVAISGIIGPQGPQGIQGIQGIQGPPGVTGAEATIDAGTGTPSVEVTLTNGVLTFAFHNLKGLQGNTGSSVSYPFTLVNNTTTDDATQALTAAMGKMLQDLIDAFVVDNDFEEEDLTIADENGFAIASFRDGEFRTKNFDSSKVKVESGDTFDDDFDIRDENGYIIVQFNGGHIKTKNFDSSLLGKSHWYGKSWMGFGTSITDTSSTGKYPTYLAQISGLVFTNHGNGGSGITSFSDEELYDDIMTADLSGADLITLEVGANDGQAPLGTIYDGLPDSEVQDNSTFCGALNLCIRRLQEDSNAQIVVMCSPSSRYQRTDPTNIYDGDETSGPDNHTILDRNEAIRKVCMLNSCWFIPAGAMDGFGYARMNASNDLNTDNVHHTNLGGYNFAQAIWAFLKNIPLFYTSI